MMIFLYFCVMMSAWTPGGESVARAYAGAVEDSFRAVVEGRNTLADQIADLRPR
jgi:hypothetical protein